MVIDKKLNLDRELEYFPDGGLSFAQNIVVSQDGLTIQNEPAIVNFLKTENFNLVGFVACNEEFVLFGKNNNIVRVNKNGNWSPCNTNWQYQGGEVFGTFTYNINNELIIAISEHNLPNNVTCPLKIINLDRDEYIEGSDDNIYTLTPDIPHSNIVDLEYIDGNKIKKGKYNFFIKYFINDNFETSWFPIGVPVFVYDNTKSTKSTLINNQLIEATSLDSTDQGDSSIPNYIERYAVVYDDYYNKDDEYTNNNVKLYLDISAIKNYTHYKLGYIINTQSGTEARSTYKYAITTKEVIVNDASTIISIDELTVGPFNIYNVNTLCNYKDRLYLANYKEENRNKDIDKIDVSSIKVTYSDEDSIVSPDITNNNFDLKNQWKSKPGRAAIYNFYIHYVYPNGNWTDGIKIGNLDTYSNKLFLGNNNSNPVYFTVNKNTTCDEIYNAFNANTLTTNINTDLKGFVQNNLGAKWWTLEHKYYTTYPYRFSINESNNELGTVINSKGDVLFCTPIDKPFNFSKLRFTNIRMYPEFVGYFISYEKPEYIQIGEGFVINNSTSNGNDLFDLGKEANSVKWKFYYPEFSIIGGKTNINRLVYTGTHTNITGNDNLYKENDLDDRYDVGHPTATGRSFNKNEFNGVDELSDSGIYGFATKNVDIVSPNTYSNIGKEGYLKLESFGTISIRANDIKSFTGISQDKNLYLADDKKLVSLGYIKYIDYNNNVGSNPVYTYGDDDVLYNYDFYRCYSSIIFFDKQGVIINQTSPNQINATTGNDFYPYKGSQLTNPFNPHVGIIKYWHESHYPLFLKQLNNGPETIFYSYIKSMRTGDSPDVITTKQLANLVLNPQTINELYKLDVAYYDYTGKIIVNYDKTLVSNQIDFYGKTIRRSDVIQSESVNNSWRYFRPENYKIITENKGNITNVVGIGNYLFAHCEHSLFLFDVTDSLQALDKNVQLLQPDSFEVAYKEVFTADKGYGGLQDYVSWVCDEFGYIFFDRSAKKIYRFDGGQLKDMTEGINNLVKVINPTEIWFGNDRERNRIMANIRSVSDNIILSYNLIANGWTSTHSYISNYKFIGLKDKLFIPNVDGNNLTVTHYIDTEFNKFTLPVGDIDNNGSYKSFIDVVFTNPNYNKIKVLDFITYILNKEPADNFELLQLEIFTNCCYSGVIDISQERKKVSEYKKPYYDFERWNFNWFRNVIDKIENGDMVDRLSGRIHTYPQKVQRGYDNALISGKYVVIRFSFKLMSKQVNIKDIQAYFKP